jgi:hypothetical protein
LREFPAVVAVVGDAEPVLRDALEAGEDLHEEVVGEGLGRRPAGERR